MHFFVCVRQKCQVKRGHKNTGKDSMLTMQGERRSGGKGGKKSKEIMPVHTEQTPTIGKDECLSHNLHSVTSTQDTIIKMVKLK